MLWLDLSLRLGLKMKMLTDFFRVFFLAVWFSPAVDGVSVFAAQRSVAWGWNEFGQLGNGSTTNNNVPAAVFTDGSLSNKTVIAVVGGYEHSLVLCSDGTVAGWGRNDYGQLGNGNNITTNVPVTVVTSAGALFNKTVVAVAGGTWHSLALCSDGTVAAWGRNTFGGLGNGNTMNTNVPERVITNTGALSNKAVVAIEAGYFHSLALCSDGTLAAWGQNNDGQLGNGQTANMNVPVPVTTATGALSNKSVVAIAAGGAHNLALCSDGTVAAWGRNFAG
jgi:alpha-tubulin suppressor-like RCC1 family protein